MHSAATDRGELMTLVAGKRRSLLMAGDDGKVFITRSLNVTLKTTEQYLTASHLPLGTNHVVNLKPK